MALQNDVVDNDIMSQCELPPHLALLPVTTHDVVTCQHVVNIHWLSSKPGSPSVFLSLSPTREAASLQQVSVESCFSEPDSQLIPAEHTYNNSSLDEIQHLLRTAADEAAPGPEVEVLGWF